MEAAMKQLTIHSASAFAATTLAALVLIPLAAAHTEGNATAAATTITVKGGEFYFKLSTKSIARPGTVTFVFKNAGHVLHDFKIKGKSTPMLQPGRTAKLTVRFTKKGRYSYSCTVPGHAAAGMKGVFTVR
jgi:uncharacterized cupredoxin-like copper-binding protein